MSSNEVLTMPINIAEERISKAVKNKNKMLNIQKEHQRFMALNEQEREDFNNEVSKVLRGNHIPRDFVNKIVEKETTVSDEKLLEDVISSGKYFIGALVVLWNHTGSVMKYSTEINMSTLVDIWS